MDKFINFSKFMRFLFEDGKQAEIASRIVKALLESQERLPDFDLEVGTAQVDRDRRTGNLIEDLLDEGGGAGGFFHQGSIGSIVPETFQRRLPVAVHKAEETDAAPSQRQQALAEGSGMKAVGDLDASTARFALARRDRFALDEQVMQPSGTGETGFVCGIQQVG